MTAPPPDPARPRRPWLRHRVPIAGLLCVAVVSAGQPAAAEETSGVPRLRLEILAEFPHDETAYTQGLLWHDGALYESTGLYGESRLRRVGLGSERAEAERRLDARYFAEGLARVGDRLIQLTYREGEAFVYDLESLEPRGALRYEGEGWGLCYDGRGLYMSDGSAEIARRDPATFAVLERLPVTVDGRPLASLNELECAEGWIYANVWQTDWIARIDPASGTVVALVDASPLRRRLGLPAGGDSVLNGIAYRPDTATFLLTGKNWPRLFEVIFVE